MRRSSGPEHDCLTGTTKTARMAERPEATRMAERPEATRVPKRTETTRMAERTEPTRPPERVGRRTAAQNRNHS